jgi:Phosphoribosyltransferase.
MTEPELNTRLQTITPTDEAARAAAHAHWAALAKPLGGLSSLETMLEDAAALTETRSWILPAAAVLVLCADHGVVSQGREPNRRQRDPSSAAKPCSAAHQRLADGSCGP